MFYTIHSLSLFCLGVLLYIFPVHEWLCHCAIIVSAFVLICLYIVYMSQYLYLWVLYTIYSLVLLHISNLVLSLSCARVVLSMHHCYILVFTNIFVHIIYMFEEVCLSTLYNIRLGCAPYWEYFHIYFLYMINSATVSPYLSTLINKSWLLPLCLNLLFSCHMHWNISSSLISQYTVYLLLF